MEKTFATCKGTNEIEVKELLLHRFHQIDYFLEMDLDEFIEFLKHTIYRVQEERVFQLYVSIYPNMTKKNNMDYKEFKNKLLPKKFEVQENISKDNFEKEMERIEKEVEVLRKGG